MYFFVITHENLLSISLYCHVRITGNILNLALIEFHVSIIYNN